MLLSYSWICFTVCIIEKCKWDECQCSLNYSCNTNKGIPQNSDSGHSFDLRKSFISEIHRWLFVVICPVEYFSLELRISYPNVIPAATRNLSVVKPGVWQSTTCTFVWRGHIISGDSNSRLHDHETTSASTFWNMYLINCIDHF
jgi:hypothetical protein